MEQIPHCGACGQPTDTADQLQAHISQCPAANALLTPVTLLMFGAKDTGHNGAHTIQCVQDARDVICEYAAAVANEVSSWERSAIHKRLCARLGIEYSTFRPFESELIREVPSYEQAIAIIYQAIGSYVLTCITK